MADRQDILIAFEEWMARRVHQAKIQHSDAVEGWQKHRTGPIPERENVLLFREAQYLAFCAGYEAGEASGPSVG